MPIYEYRCKSCGNVVEVIQKFDDKPLRKCRQCSGGLEKMISRTSFQLKGGGWFAQGYGGKGGGSKPAKEAGKKSKADAKSSESKSAD